MADKSRVMSKLNGSNRRFKERNIRKLIRPRIGSEPVILSEHFCDAFYTAKTSYGPVGLAASIKVESNADITVGDALHGLVLGVVESKIQFIENWLRFVLDIEPGEKQAEGYSELFTIREELEPGSNLTMHLPVQYWHLIPEFPKKYFPDYWELSWAAYKGSLNLSKLTMSSEEADQISSGSLVLIPESFGEQWSCAVSVPELSVSLPGTYDEKASSWTAAGGFEAISTESVIPMDNGKVDDNDSGIDVRGVISHSLEVPTKTLIPALQEQTLRTVRESTHQECRLALSNGKFYSGYVAPVASGYGLFVTGSSSL